MFGNSGEAKKSNLLLPFQRKLLLGKNVLREAERHSCFFTIFFASAAFVSCRSYLSFLSYLSHES